MDMGLALFATATAYAFWEYAESDSPGWFYAAGVFLGLALATKFTAVLTVAGLGVGAVIFCVAGRQFSLPGRTAYGVLQRLSVGLSAFVRLGLVAAAVVTLSYWGVHVLDWGAGLKQQLFRGEYGDPHFFLDGEISSTGWWRYFPEVLAIKTPPATLILAAVSIVLFFLGRRLTARDAAFLIVPPLGYGVAMAAMRFDIGWRVLLPAYPLLILVAARTATLVPRTGSLQTMVVASLTGAVLWSVTEARYLGRELSYANGLGATRANLHERLGDSNIDWGQGLKALKADLAQWNDPVIYLSYAGTARPEAYGIRHERLPGWGQFHPPTVDTVGPAGPVLVAVSVSNLQGTYLSNPHQYHWLREREPVSRTDGSIWLFDVTGDAKAIQRLQQLAKSR
jgi:4-amino-4-deoxy-L-arabinose transferase-like glycosyltransferase